MFKKSTIDIALLCSGKPKATGLECTESKGIAKGLSLPMDDGKSINVLVAGKIMQHPVRW